MHSGGKTSPNRLLRNDCHKTILPLAGIRLTQTEEERLHGGEANKFSVSQATPVCKFLQLLHLLQSKNNVFWESALLCLFSRSLS